MSTLAEKQALRLKFMNALYEITDGDENVHVRPEKLAGALGLELPEVEDEENKDYREYRKVVDYLKGEGLIRLVVNFHYGPVRITHEGIDEVETALSDPTQPTEHFGPAGVVLNIGNYVGTAIHSPVQQSGPNSTQSMSGMDSNLKGELESFVASLKDTIDQLDLSNEARQEIDTEIQTIEVQLSGPNPKSSIINEALQSTKRALEGAAGNVAGTVLMSNIDSLSHALSLLPF